MRKKNPKHLKILIIHSKLNNYDKKCIEYIKKFNVKLKKVISTDRRRENLKSQFRNWSGDYIIHLSSYYKLTEADLNRANFAINLHPSSPKYPGSGGYSKALYNSDKNFGVTVHFMNKKIDNGIIIRYFSFKLKKDTELLKLIKKTSNFKFVVFKKIIKLICSENGSLKLVNLSKHNKFKWAKKRGKIKDIDRLQKINFSISKFKLNKIIKSTNIGKFKPFINLHGFKFELKN